MSVQPRLITLDEFNPNDTSLMYVEYLGKNELAVIDDAILYALIEKYKLEGEKEIIKMVDRGQIFQSQAERVLGADKYREVGKLVPCE